MAVLCNALFLLTIATAAVDSFRLNPSDGRDFGDEDFYNRKYQTWPNKRGLGSGHQLSYTSFGLPLGENYHRYFNWKDYLAGVMPKRQLTRLGPRSFGDYRRYFANGLQDWKSSFSRFT